MSLGQLASGRVSELDSADEIMAHCKSGMRSAKAVEFLKQAGFRKVHNMNGGILAWSDNVYPVRGREQASFRPVLILSNDLFNRPSGTVIAMAITSQAQRAGFSLTLQLRSDKLPKSSWVKISQIRTIPIERLGKRMAFTEAEELDQIVDGLLEIVR